jgi:hypothetical protein
MPLKDGPSWDLFSGLGMVTETPAQAQREDVRSRRERSRGTRIIWNYNNIGG